MSIDQCFVGEILILIKMGNQESTKVNNKEYISSFMARTFILNHNKSHENIQICTCMFLFIHKHNFSNGMKNQIKYFLSSIQ